MLQMFSNKPTSRVGSSHSSAVDTIDLSVEKPTHSHTSHDTGAIVWSDGALQVF
jgi:hypothetical protein